MQIVQQWPHEKSLLEAECLHSIWSSKTFTLLGIILFSSLLRKYTLAGDDPGSLNIVNTKKWGLIWKRWWTACELLIFAKHSQFTVFLLWSPVSIPQLQPCLYKSLCIFSGNVAYIGERMYIVVQNLSLAKVLIFLYYVTLKSLLCPHKHFLWPFLFFC